MSIECSFRKIGNTGFPDLKDGRYSQSNFWEIKDFGTKKWVVLGYLDVDWMKEREISGFGEKEVISACLEHLNKKPERKKHQKKDSVPVYGNLELFKADFKIKDGKPFIIVQFITDQHNNEHFWGEGPTQNGFVSPRRKKEDREEEIEETQL